MITVNGHLIKATQFPDGTSQVWNLPEALLKTRVLLIDWRFEAERELMDLYSLRKLLRKDAAIHLHVPFLPYGRQDKAVSNDTTFNLAVFADLINNLDFLEVTSVDVHNPVLTGKLIKAFRNEEVGWIHSKLIAEIRPDYIVFPDVGASTRYIPLGTTSKKYMSVPYLILHKLRDQATGSIVGHSLDEDFNKYCPEPNTSFLMLDDICDGGATFLSAARALNKNYEGSHTIHLYVTHGVFSKGRKVLEDAGIKVCTTNSLCHNKDGIGV